LDEKVRDIKDSIKLDAVLANFDDFMDFIDFHCIEAGVDKNIGIKILTACDEVVANVIHYAYPDGNGSLEIGFESNENSVIVIFIDSGRPFNPLMNPDADVSIPLEERAVGGLGILMVKNLMDDVRYEYRDNQNRLTVVKHWLN
jgi:serine/threonine-protein kinase RsbW